MRIRATFVVLTSLAVVNCGEQSVTSPTRLTPSSGVADLNTPLPVLASTVSPVSGRIAFTSDRDGTRAIYVAAGTEVRRLGAGDRPKWSPNGAQLVFQLTSPGVGIYIINADGTGLRYVTQGYSPSWSPDGTRIVFSYGDIVSGGLYVVNADGSNRTRIVDGEAISASAEEAVWSPDGRTIAFIRANYDDPWQLYLVAPDGSSLRALMHPSGGIVTQDNPEWSPDGSQFVFHSYTGIVVSNSDGTAWQGIAQGLSPDWMAGGFVYAKPTGPGPTTRGGSESRIFAIENGAERQVIPDASTGRKYADMEPDWTR